MANFTRYRLDKSTESGFQFEYFCDRCNSSHLTAFQPYPIGIAKQLIEGASDLIGKKWNWAQRNFDMFEKNKAWDEAQKKALQEAKGYFVYCEPCNRWVCWASCWDAATRSCKSCTERLEAKRRAQQAAKAKKEVKRCWNCNNPHHGGRFCADCGKAQLVVTFCGQCGKKLPEDRQFKFCPYCGDTIFDAD